MPCSNVEHFLNVIGSRIGVDKGSYYSYTKNLLSRLNMYDDDKFKMLNAPAQIRGRLYKFVKSKPIMYTGWENMYKFFDELLDIMIEVTDKHALRKIPKIKHTSKYNNWLPWWSQYYNVALMKLNIGYISYYIISNKMEQSKKYFNSFNTRSNRVHV